MRFGFTGVGCFSPLLCKPQGQAARKQSCTDILAAARDKVVRNHILHAQLKLNAPETHIHKPEILVAS